MEGMQKSMEETAHSVGEYFKTNYNRLTKDENSYIQKVLRKLRSHPVSEQNKNRALDLKHQGNSLYNEGKYKEAMEKYNEALEADPSNYVIYSNRALTFVQLGKTEEAINECLTGIEYEPAFVKFYIRLAKIYWSIDKKVSLMYVKRGLEFEPENEVLLDLKVELMPVDDSIKTEYRSMFNNKELDEQAKIFFKGMSLKQIQDWMSNAMKKGK